MVSVTLMLHFPSLDLEGIFPQNVFIVCTPALTVAFYGKSLNVVLTAVLIKNGNTYRLYVFAAFCLSFTHLISAFMMVVWPHRPQTGFQLLLLLVRV